MCAHGAFNLFSRFCTISASYYPLYYYITIPWYSWDRSRQQLRTVSPGPAQARQRTSETTLNSHGAPPDPIMPLSMSPIPSPQEPRVISRCTSKGDSFPSYTTSMKSDLYRMHILLTASPLMRHGLLVSCNIEEDPILPGKLLRELNSTIRIFYKCQRAPILQIHVFDALVRVALWCSLL